MTTWNKVLSSIAGLLIVAAIGAIVYITQFPPVGERFTEFYILGLSGEAIEYPDKLKVGEEGKVMVGIVNHEHEVVSYRVELMINGVENSEVEAIVLEHDEMWEGEVSFTPFKTGNNQKVEFLLFKNEEVEPCYDLHLWIDVTQ